MSTSLEFLVTREPNLRERLRSAGSTQPNASDSIAQAGQASEPRRTNRAGKHLQKPTAEETAAQ
jgi:hypothetical protein